MKGSFLLHIDSLCILDKMTDEQAGVLLKAIYHYQLHGELPVLDFAIEMAVIPFINQFKRNNEKYEQVIEKRKYAGSLGGKQKVANIANATSAKQKVANVAVSDSVNVSVSDSVNVNDSVNEKKEKNTKNVFSPPTSLEVENYFFENGYKREAGTKAYNYYSVANWQDSKGNKVKNWKQKMQAVWFKDENKIMIVQPSRQPLVNYGRYVID
jgi:hypothetical protein